MLYRSPSVKLAAFVFVLYLNVAAVCADNGATAEDASASGCVQWITEYAAARRQGMAKDRPLLLFVTSDHCQYCVKMKDETLSNTTIVHQLREKFVSAQLKLKMDDELAKQLQVTIYPTTMIISPDGKILDYARGYLGPDELSAHMSNALVERHRLASRN